MIITKKIIIFALSFVGSMLLGRRVTNILERRCANVLSATHWNLANSELLAR